MFKEKETLLIHVVEHGLASSPMLTMLYTM